MMVQAAFIKDLMPNTRYQISIQSVFNPIGANGPIQSKSISVEFNTLPEDDEQCYNDQTVSTTCNQRDTVIQLVFRGSIFTSLMNLCEQRTGHKKNVCVLVMDTVI